MNTLPPKPGSQTLRIERTFACTQKQMWDAWTDPEQYAQWISPFPGNAEIHKFEAREGGEIRFTMIAPDGTRYADNGGIFEVFKPTSELVMYEANDKRNDIFAGHPMRLHARFEPAGADKTRLVFEQTGLPASFPLDAARGGFGACFDKLAAIVEKKTTA